jgi:membrane associated rhomboid family serine protease
MSSQTGRPWTLGTGDAESALAEARKALFVMAGFLAILWIIQLVNVADGYRLSQDYGIRPHDVASLPDILTSPFLHLSWSHIEGNSGPLFIFGFLAAYRGVVRFLGLTVLIIVVSGLAYWLTASPHSYGDGASGVVFGYLGYILVRGIFDRHAVDLLIGAIMALCFAYQFTVLLPHAGIGWQDHIGGLAAGILGGWIFRDRSPRPARQGVRATAASGSPGSQGVTTGAGVAVPRPAPASPAASTGQGKGKDAGTGKYSGPRADLYQQLDDMGL